MTDKRIKTKAEERGHLSGVSLIIRDHLHHETGSDVPHNRVLLDLKYIGTPRLMSPTDLFEKPVSQRLQNRIDRAGKLGLCFIFLLIQFNYNAFTV